MSQHNICRGLTVKTVVKSQRTILEGVYFNDIIVIQQWEDIACLSLIATDFTREKFPKWYKYTLGEMSFEHVEQEKIHYLKMIVLDEIYYLNNMEVKIIPAILNRVIARCDILNRTDADVVYKKYPIVVAPAHEEGDYDS